MTWSLGSTPSDLTAACHDATERFQASSSFAVEYAKRSSVPSVAKSSSVLRVGAHRHEGRSGRRRRTLMRGAQRVASPKSTQDTP